MCVDDAEHDFKNSLFKTIVYVKYEFLLVGAFGQWSVGRWSVVGWSVSRWSVVGGRLVGGFKETHGLLAKYFIPVIVIGHFQMVTFLNVHFLSIFNSFKGLNCFHFFILPINNCSSKFH